MNYAHIVAKIKMLTASSEFGPLVFLGSLILVSGVVTLLVMKYAKARKRRKHRHHHHREQPAPEPVKPANVDAEGRTRVRKRKRRSAYPALPMNPTLAETGGLPPLRGEDSSPSDS